MVSSVDHFEALFREAERSWQLDQLYADLEKVAGKPLKSYEKACLRGLLCRFRPGEIANACVWSSGAMRVELNKGLYRYIEILTGNPLNSLRWEKVSEWLEAKGYRLQQALVTSSMPAQIDWGNAPEVNLFFSRTRDLQLLEKWIVGDRTRLVAIYGMGGIGKTTLAVKLVERICGHFERVVWRSLKNAPPPNALITDLIQGNDLDTLLHYFRQGRHLFILDDFETVLQDGELVGAYRQGCQGYGELIQRLGTERHSSCGIILSREQPKEVASLQGDDLPVRAYKLSGLDLQGAIALLQSRGFRGSEAGLQIMIEQYRGNPAALKLVSGTIREIFNGDVTEFLKQTGLAIGDTLKALLYQQFERLSILEKDILYCISLKRRPVSLGELRSASIVEDSGSDLISALESLCWRSLIEKVTEGGQTLLQLEPVVLKYVQRKFVEEVNRELDEFLEHRQLGRLELLGKHPLVEDSASEAIRAVQIRLVLKPIKDRMHKLMARENMEDLSAVIGKYLGKLPAERGYLETNLSLLGWWY
ncbi:MAG: NB-ARC domain-containing protein [Pseudanabaenaceae cyanobacterium]